MTNFDKIKNMSADEMAKLIDKIGNCPCCCCDCKECIGDGSPEKCAAKIKEWLTQEAE